jgi:hypothetical protein
VNLRIRFIEARFIGTGTRSVEITAADGAGQIRWESSAKLALGRAGQVAGISGR